MGNGFTGMGECMDNIERVLMVCVFVCVLG